MVQLEAIEPPLLVLTKKVGRSRIREGAVRIGMTVANRAGLAALLEAFARKLADRLEHQQARLVVVGLAAQQAVIGQVVEPGQHIATDLLGGPADELGLFEVRASREDREPIQEALLVLVEHLVAPVDCAAQRLLTSRQISGAAAQGGKAGFETGQKRLRREE